MELTRDLKEYLVLAMLARVKSGEITKAEAKVLFDAYRPYKIGDDIPIR